MDIEDTIFEEGLPVNSIAMFNRGIEILREANTNCILSLTTRTEAHHKMRKLMWLLMQQLYSRSAVIDMCNQWDELLTKEDAL